MIRIKGKEIFLIISLSLIFLYILIYYTCPILQEEINLFNKGLENFARSYGYLGAFIVSFAGAASVFILIPYPAFVFILTAAGLNIWLLSLLAGLGAALGEITGYLLGYGSGRLIDKDYAEKFERIRKIFSQRPKLIPFLVFIFGLTPLPDDLLFIPLGFIGYSFKKAFLAGFVGKFTMLLLISYFGVNIFNFFHIDFYSTGGIIAQAITLALSVIIMYALLKIDWHKLINKIDIDNV